MRQGGHRKSAAIRSASHIRYAFTRTGRSPLCDFRLARTFNPNDGIWRGVTHDTWLRTCHLGYDGDGRCNARTAFTAQANQLRRGWKYAEKRSGKEGWLVN